MKVICSGGEWLVPLMNGRRQIRMGTRQAAGKQKAGA